jgi:hypothetical protein
MNHIGMVSGLSAAFWWVLRTVTCERRDGSQTNVCYLTGSDMECPSGPPARDSIYHGAFLYSYSSFLLSSFALDYHFVQRGQFRINNISLQCRLSFN